MRSLNPDSRLHLRATNSKKVNSEQATLLLGAQVYIGKRGAKELLELVFRYGKKNTR